MVFIPTYSEREVKLIDLINLTVLILEREMQPDFPAAAVDPYHKSITMSTTSFIIRSMKWNEIQWPYEFQLQIIQKAYAW